jgi:O-antigen/teichoic acid export membrane protein
MFAGIMKSLRTRDGAVWNGLTLITGTAFGQLVALMSSPIVARYYGAAEMGEYALYFSLSSICVILIGGKFESAIIVAASDSQAEQLRRLTIVIALYAGAAVAILASAIFLLRSTLGIQNFRVWWIVLVPLTSLITMHYLVAYYSANREKRYRDMAYGKSIPMLFSATGSIALAFVHPTAPTLIVVNVLSQFIAFIIIEKRPFISLSRKDFHLREMQSLMSEYYRFPCYSLPADFVNVAANQAPNIMLYNYFGSTAVGYYSLTTRVLSQPLNLVANTMLDIFRQQAVDEHKKCGKCPAAFRRMLLLLFGIGLVPLTVLMLFSEKLFGLVFGNDWVHAGLIAKILAPMFFIKLVVSPLSYVYTIANKQKFDLLGNIIMLISSVGAILVGGSLNNLEASIYLNGIAIYTVYAFYLYNSHRYANGG